MKKKKLLDRLKEEIRRRNYSYNTEKVYCQWVVRFVRYHNFKHPAVLRQTDVVKYFNNLANELNVAASTQNQALSAIVFLNKYILEQPLEHLNDLKRAKRPKRLPVVLTEKEVISVISSINVVHNGMAFLLRDDQFYNSSNNACTSAGNACYATIVHI